MPVHDLERDGVLGDAQSAGDFFVGLPGRKQAEDLLLSFGQGGGRRPRLGRGPPLTRELGEKLRV
jgi:hypothetical protein